MSALYLDDKIQQFWWLSALHLDAKIHQFWWVR